MKREVITLDGNCKVAVPSDAANVWMSEMELVGLFGVIAPTLCAAIRAVYKSGVLLPYEVERRIKQSNGYFVNVYAIPMVVALAFRINTPSASTVRNALLENAGAKDCVATLTLTQESAKEYGESLTVTFVYYQKDRIALEKDKTALNDIPNVKAKELLGELDDILHAKLLKDGIPTNEIVEMLLGPPSEENNTYASSLLRKPKVLEIPIESEGNGFDIFLCMGPYLILFLMESD